MSVVHLRPYRFAVRAMPSARAGREPSRNLRSVSARWATIAIAARIDAEIAL